MSRQISFLLNDRKVTTDCQAGTPVLDYLRRNEQLAGTKEGCKEGDCGACVVLIGELSKEIVHYKPVTSCLEPIADLHGKHLVTIEGLNMESLSPVQQAIVDEGGSQCGFCTPGIVVSLTGLLLESCAGINGHNIKDALSGHFCRCTGYDSLKRAGNKLIQQFSTNRSSANNTEETQQLHQLIKQKVLPPYFVTIPARLKKIPSLPADDNRTTPDFFIAGGTDLYVQNGDELPDSKIGVLNLQGDKPGIYLEKGRVHVSALTTFEAFSRHPAIIKIILHIEEYNRAIASWQIRNRATLGGNIINASPIGDLTVLLLALESNLVLRAGVHRRTVDLKSFFQGYKKLDKKPREILTEIIFPVPAAGAKINFEKISKRKTLDIASVNSAIKVLAAGDNINAIEITMGGVAPIPLFMSKTCDFLLGKTITVGNIRCALEIAQAEISPISDIRGSSDYKRLLVRQLIIAHFTKLFPEFIKVREFYETH